MRIIFALFCIFFSQMLVAQKNLVFDFYSPDTLRYDIQIKKDSNAHMQVKVDFGSFNFKDEPEVSFYVRPFSHPFILDNSFWNIAYLKPVYDKHIIVAPGNSEKVIAFKYISKYNHYFNGSFQQNTSANTNQGKIYFEIKGAYLPAYIHFSKCSSYHQDAETGKNITDTLIISNRGKEVLVINSVVNDEGVEMQKENTNKILIYPGKKKKIFFSYTPYQKGRFSKAAVLNFSRPSSRSINTAEFKIRGFVK